MKKLTVLKFINVVLFILFLSQAITGTGHEVVPGKIFEILHMKGGIVLIILILVHFTLNWGWVKSSYFRKI